MFFASKAETWQGIYIYRLNNTFKILTKVATDRCSYNILPCQQSEVCSADVENALLFNFHNCGIKFSHLMVALHL